LTAPVIRRAVYYCSLAVWNDTAPRSSQLPIFDRIQKPSQIPLFHSINALILARPILQLAGPEILTMCAFCIIKDCLITFRVSRRRREMYSGYAKRVCLSVCVSVCGRMPTLLHGPGCNLGNCRGCPLVVHCCADLQSAHGLRCYGNTARTRNVSECLYSL